jgi:hypothetical protein
MVPGSHALDVLFEFLVGLYQRAKLGVLREEPL